MKATITNEYREWDREVGGWLRKKYVKESGYILEARVEFTEEEKGILTERKLWKTVLWSKQESKDLRFFNTVEQKYNTTTHQIQFVINPRCLATGEHGPDYGDGVIAPHWKFDTPHEALEMENHLKTVVFPRLKQLLEDFEQLPSNRTETLEF